MTLAELDCALRQLRLSGMADGDHEGRDGETTAHRRAPSTGEPSARQDSAFGSGIRPSSSCVGETADEPPDGRASDDDEL